MAEQNRWYKSGSELLDEIDLSLFEKGSAGIWFIGQHGFIIKLNNKVIYIDPLFNDLLDENGVSKRVFPPPFAPDMPKRADYVFCTHNHDDHLNLATLLPLSLANPEVVFIVPAPHRGLLTAAGISRNRVLGALEGEELSLNAGITVTPLAAAHPDYLQEKTENGSSGGYLCLGYVIRGGGVTLYHSGDTYVTPRLLDSLKKLAPIDIAMLPINGGDWERGSQDIIGNMSALEAVKLARALQADLTIPAHYDLMAVNSEDPGLFAGYMYRLCPAQRFHIFALGERFCYVK
jgi:L-ascorbate metabolism protein UlaG (beta-lactamase superfamily)